MNFLGLGPGELLLIMLLALIVFGPGKLPEIGAGIGKAMGEFRRASTDITREITRELQVDVQPQEPRRAAPAAWAPPVAAEPEVPPAVSAGHESAAEAPGDGVSPQPAAIATGEDPAEGLPANPRPESRES